MKNLLSTKYIFYGIILNSSNQLENNIVFQRFAKIAKKCKQKFMDCKFKRKTYILNIYFSYIFSFKKYNNEGWD